MQRAYRLFASRLRSSPKRAGVKPANYSCLFRVSAQSPLVRLSRKSRSVGAWLGLTTRRYQSGEVDYDGHISLRGDRHLRGLLYEAATVILTRSSAESDLRTWGLKLKERVGFKRAAVAVARKLAVTMHAMLKSSTIFERTAKASG